MKIVNYLLSAKGSQFILCLFVVLANIDYISILDYTIKAVIGATVWFGFKLIADRYSEKTKKQTLKNEEQ